MIEDPGKICRLDLCAHAKHRFDVEQSVFGRCQLSLILSIHLTRKLWRQKSRLPSQLRPGKFFRAQCADEESLIYTIGSSIREEVRDCFCCTPLGSFWCPHSRICGHEGRESPSGERADGGNGLSGIGPSLRREFPSVSRCHLWGCAMTAFWSNSSCGQDSNQC
jgi:hypothetical protein